ncbi:hypothetical protein ZIOFF_047074 [Zingiber officinale]|uniref:Uncharacterized protein n=1 Tax=Zingiber officinale TaxID=94328 RepID=A0A8J5KWE5_ZINOF|nr:hypothetical protein ZIOFF_047074 [Zingiber officinale]
MWRVLHQIFLQRQISKIVLVVQIRILQKLFMLQVSFLRYYINLANFSLKLSKNRSMQFGKLQI